VAVDPEGNVWVDAGEQTHVDEFSDTGSFVKSFENEAGTEPGFTVDSSDNVYLVNGRGGVSKYESSGTRITGFFGFSSNVSALAIDSATNDLFVDRASSIDQYGPFGEPFSEPLATFPSEGLSASHGIAVNAKTGTVYATQREAGSVEIFDAVPFPVVGAEPVSNRAVRSVTLNGTVDPEGVEVTSCEFEYGTKAGVYPQKEPCSQTLPLTGSAPVPVSANLAGLAPDTTYHYRLVATNADNLTEVTPDQEFTTRGAGFSDESAENVEPTAATLQARINPNESETTYHFEYDTSPYNTSASHGTSLPVPNADIGSGTSPVQVSVQLKGLQPGTSYHYRVVAVSELAPGVFETFDGPDKSLTTPTPPTPPHSEGCPNEQLRAEQPFGLLLPDCRAYEQVSPVDKNGYDIVRPGGGGLTEDLARASVSGEAITYVSFGSFADPAAAMYVSRYVSRRGAGGWSTQNITPPYSSHVTNIEEPYWSLVFTPELSMGVVETNGGAVGGCENLYLADIASSSYQPLALNCGNGPWVQGASTDLSHIVFTPEAGGQLEEWVGGQLSVVDVANDGSYIPAHPGGQPAGVPPPEFTTEDRWHAVSDDGLRVFFTGIAEGTADYRQLYVRENPEQTQSPLNGEKCTVSSDACTVEVSASQKTNGSGLDGTDPHGPQPAEYLGASVDGSKVFFDSRAELTNKANTGGADNAANLYEYDLKSGVLTDLTVDTNAGDLEGAAVLGMVTAGEDGSYVYYVADGVLALGAAPGNCAAHPNESPPGATCNLYVQHYNGTEWTPPVFIATLAGGDFSDWLNGFNGEEGVGGPANNNARITPDGTHLAFLSKKSLTGYDNQPAKPADCTTYAGVGKISIPCSEVFSFDATQPVSPENPVCVSCNPSGARPVGPSRLSEIESGPDPFYYTPRNFSEDGSRLFFDSRDALVPHDSNGRQDVYEYEGGHVYLISDGAGSYDSSFLDASPSGGDVFIATADRLVPQDRDSQVDVYDAKVGGGFPASVSAPACDNGDSCKGPVSPQPPVFGAPASATFSGAGNLAPVVSPPAVLKPKTAAQLKAEKLTKALKACKKDKSRKKRAACVKQAHKKYGASKAKKAGNERRAK
jgi:hypothetical protein